MGNIIGAIVLGVIVIVIIEQKGYINLDFMGNLGHSIVRQKSDRVYIEKGNLITLGDVVTCT